MANHKGQIDRDGGSSTVDAGSDIAITSGMLVRLENLVAEREGERVEDIRDRLADRLKTTAGTLANIRKRRRKVPPPWLMRAIRDELVRMLEKEVKNLAHEIDVWKSLGLDHREDAFGQAIAALSEARACLEAAKRGHREALRAGPDGARDAGSRRSPVNGAAR